MKYHITWLREKFRKGEKLKFLPFWGHQPSTDGSITASCFSQWWPAVFEVSGSSYATAEHWMMAQKAKLFGDAAIANRIREARTAAEAKQLGRMIQHFDAVMWDREKYRIVVQGNDHKFSQHAALSTFLLATKDRILVEASPVDPVWGIGLAADNPAVENPLLWKGENLLGFALMEVRDRLKGNNTK